MSSLDEYHGESGSDDLSAFLQSPNPYIENTKMQEALLRTMVCDQTNQHPMGDTAKAYDYLPLNPRPQ